MSNGDGGATRFWTIVGGVAGVVGVVMTIVLAMRPSPQPVPEPASQPTSVATTEPIGPSSPEQAPEQTQPPVDAPVVTTPPRPTQSTPSTPAGPPTPVEVPYSRLCKSGTEYYGCISAEKTVSIGTTLFSYAGYSSGYPYAPKWRRVLQFGATSCTELVLNFAVPSTKAGDASIHVVQTNTPEAVAVTPLNTVGSLTVALDGGPFYVEATATVDISVYLNGHATCTTFNGLP